jgi:UDP-glucose:(heptosyl)LPS alpha-1,3-glucosyltransferase
MKVALSFPACHRHGGVERVMYECARFLATRGHEVHVLAGAWQDDLETFAHCHDIAHRSRPWFIKGGSFHRKCTEFLGQFDYDVLNSHGVVSPTGGVQWVHSLHAAWLERSRLTRPALSLTRLKQRLNPLHRVLLGLEEKHFRAGAYHKLIATTPAVRADLERFYDVPARDVVIVPNGFSPTEFSAEIRAARREAMREKLGLRPHQIALLFVANELQRKGYRTVLSALRLLRRSDLRLLVVGKPPVEAVRRLAAEHGVGELVMACGPTLSVADFHAAADLFVLPTQYEAFCLAILEALGSGLPVVTSDVPGAGDAIVPRVNGELIGNPNCGRELAAALAPLLRHEVLEEYSRRTPASVESYQWPRVLAGYEKVLAKCARRVGEVANLSAAGEVQLA